MPESKKELTNSAKTKKPLGERAREVEEQWRAELGLSKGLHRRGNATAGECRRRAECPKESESSGSVSALSQKAAWQTWRSV